MAQPLLSCWLGFGRWHVVVTVGGGSGSHARFRRCGHRLGCGRCGGGGGACVDEMQTYIVVVVCYLGRVRWWYYCY